MRVNKRCVVSVHLGGVTVRFVPLCGIGGGGGVPVRVAVGGTVPIGTGVLVLVAVGVGTGVLVRVAVGRGVLVGMAVFVGVAVGGRGVGVAVSVGVLVGRLSANTVAELAALTVATRSSACRVAATIAVAALSTRSLHSSSDKPTEARSQVLVSWLYAQLLPMPNGLAHPARRKISKPATPDFRARRMCCQPERVRASYRKQQHCQGHGISSSSTRGK